MSMTRRFSLGLSLLAFFCTTAGVEVRGDDSAKTVQDSIARAQRFLVGKQRPDGSWKAEFVNEYSVGITSLATRSLLNSGMKPDDPEIEKAVRYLRKLKTLPTNTYETSLMIMALAAVKDPRHDSERMSALVKQLENSQTKRVSAGSWSYEAKGDSLLGSEGDRSNAQFAVVALHEAQEAGVPVTLETWRRARSHWKQSQNLNGGWNYSGPGNRGEPSTGSMTAAGISCLIMTEHMLRLAENDAASADTPPGRGEPSDQEPVEKALRWLGNPANYSVTSNPKSKTWTLYYLVGLERAARLTGRRFLGEGAERHDWYREGAGFLVETQSAKGSWKGQNFEADEIVGTSLGLIFLAKGASPVLMNKLEYGPKDAGGKRDPDWNRHPHDARSLAQALSGLPKWPRLVTWQICDLDSATLADLQQAPILFISGSRRPEFSDAQAARLRQYVDQGGFIFAERTCEGADFDKGFQHVLQQMFGGQKSLLRRLSEKHPVYSSEYQLDSSVELWGGEVGGRTAIMYSPQDVSCLWERATFKLANTNPEPIAESTRALHVGINMAAYATGRTLRTRPLQDAGEEPLGKSQEDLP